ncbi:MAG: zinc dependent phospholipase C family protein [Clostridia bacterium]|nr:zinc dependent phospholipase C family protein [Clostridia bacterium]
MATWITHMMVADSVMQKLPWLDRRGFCVGNVAPDCNIENEDWTSFTPSREVTHWMSGDKKIGTDAERFLSEYVLKRISKISSIEEYSFLLGYYSHLVADAEFQKMIRDPERVAEVWKRIDADPEVSARAQGMVRTWDSVKIIVPKKERFREIYSIEGEYLRRNPSSGYYTEILTLKEFPDYIDYLPNGAIVRKIPKMTVNKELLQPIEKYISITENEVEAFVAETVAIVTRKIEEIGERR